jgi:hypothetical protein
MPMDLVSASVKKKKRFKHPIRMLHPRPASSPHDGIRWDLRQRKAKSLMPHANSDEAALA